VKVGTRLVLPDDVGLPKWTVSFTDWILDLSLGESPVTAILVNLLIFLSGFEGLNDSHRGVSGIMGLG
jgi:hypothetical protein